MLGIGALHHNEPDGIAWKQNKDFENLLKRLNETGAKDGDDSSSKLEDGGEAVGREDVNDAAGKKRKHDKGLDGDAERNAKKMRRKCTEDKKSEQAIAEVTKSTKAAEDDYPHSTPAAYIVRHRAHRARAIASKNMASKSSAAISEILGIVPTSSSSIASGPVTPSSSSADGLILETLTTSTKSVADYFRDKLLARSSAKSGTTTPVTLQTDSEYEADGHDAPRVGLGSFRSNPQLFSSVPSISSVPKNQSSLHDPVSNILSVETQTKSTSQVTRKTRREKYLFVLPDKSAAGEASKYAKGDKRAQNEKRSRDKQ